MEMGLLKTVYGEIELIRARSPKSFKDEDAVEVFKKFKAGVEETIRAMQMNGNEVPTTMREEISLYEEYIPPSLSVEDIQAILAVRPDGILAAKSDGMATGIAIGMLKKQNVVADGGDVNKAVRLIRA
jgi:uncharacterized protein YqeY